jgi:lipooligosaccharide transport system ATP-binding protein
VTREEPAIRAEDLAKHFGKIRAVDGVSFDVPRGVSFGFLGPNGAGKTSIMRMISCLSRPTGGTLRVLGLDPLKKQKEIKKNLGIVPQTSSLDEDLSVFQNLMLFARYHAIDAVEAGRRARDLLKFVELADREKARVPELSGGMQRRLLIARALINGPRILILDEPTSGLDPQVRHMIWQRLRALKRQGITLLLTTHYMDEAENLCDDIVIMNQGKILERGHPVDLVKRYIGGFTLEIPVDGEGAEEVVRAGFDDPECTVERFGDRIYVHAEESDTLTRRMGAVARFEPVLRPSSLEDVFLRLTGRELTGGA